MSIQLQVYQATLHDQPQILHLLEHSRRSFAAFGPEDLSPLLAGGNCMVAMDRDTIAAFLCVSVNRARWAYLRGLAIRDGWRTDEGLHAVLAAAEQRLRAAGIDYLAVYGTALWLPPALVRAGFERREWIVSLERHVRPEPNAPAASAHIRPLGASDLGRLAALDMVAFEPPYQLASGELVELMVTSGHFIVAESTVGDGPPDLVGYACADVLGDTGQIMRLAVHPAAQRQGIGRALLNHALAYCQAGGARRVTINTQESNRASLHLYQQLGFRQVGRRVPLLVRTL